MTLDWNEHPGAREEFLDADESYLAIESGRLSDEFADAAESAAGLIVYVVHEEEILVLAYAHEARRPGYWSHRLGQ